MSWLVKKANWRANPNILWEGAKSVIMLGHNYAPPTNPLEKLTQKTIGNISCYAQNEDYHDIIKKKLKMLARWLVESQRCEVKVFVDTAPVMEKPLAAQAGRRQITSEGGAGGTGPLWLPGASGELAYRSGDQVFAVRVATEPTFMVGRPRPFAQGDGASAPSTTSPATFLPATLLTRNYDAMPDGQRLVIARAEEDRTRVTHLNVVLNWFDELRKRVPVPAHAQPTRLTHFGGGGHTPVMGTRFSEAQTLLPSTPPRPPSQ